jgi:hypothetical protein
VADVVLTDHARERAAEMGILTRRIKAVVRCPEIMRPRPLDGPDGWMAHGDGLSVPFRQVGDLRVVVTVLWNTPEPFERSEP